MKTKQFKDMTQEERHQSVKDNLVNGMRQFIGKRGGKKISKEIKRTMQKLLGQMEADLFSYEIKKCDSLWNTFSLKEKINWYWAKLTGKAAKTRAFIDEKNKIQYQYAVEQAEADEDLETDAYAYYERMEYPDWAQSTPKGIIRFETVIKPTQSFEWIPLSVQLDDLEVSDEK